MATLAHRAGRHKAPRSSCSVPTHEVELDVGVGAEQLEAHDTHSSSRSVSADEDEGEAARRALTGDGVSAVVVEGEVDEAPECGVLWFVCALLGVGFLVPWHAVITAVDYLMLVFPQRAVQFDVVVAYALPNALTFAVAVWWADRVPVRVRVVGGFALFFACLLAVPLLAWAGLLAQLYFVLLALVALIGVGDGWAQSGIYAYAALLSARHVVAVQTGMGVSGLVVSLARILSKALLSAHVGAVEAHVYFGLGALTMLACIAAFELSRSLVHAQRAFRILAHTAAASPSSASAAVDRRAVWRRVWAPCVCTFATLATTIGIYPGVVGEVARVYGDTSGWVTLSLITLYNVGDLCAKTLPRWPLFLARVPLRSAGALTVARLLLVPLLLACVAPRLLTALAWPYVFTLLLAATNGYLGSYFLARTPALVHEHERDAAMTMLIAAIVGGIAAGSFIGYGLSLLVR